MAYNFDDMEILGVHDRNELMEPELLTGDDLIEHLIDTEPVEMLPVEEKPEEREPRRADLKSQEVNRGGSKMNVDITAAIDVTGSMQKLIDVIKRDVVRLRDLVHDPLVANLAMKRKDRELNRMRIRIVAFRDYNYDGEAELQPWHGPMLTSDFYDLDDEFDRQSLQEFMDKLEATGGEDEPESALEALHYAINSPWDFDESAVHRHLIMLFTDAPAHPLTNEDPEKRNEGNKYYPLDADMPGDLVSLHAEYENPALIDTSAHRLVIFAPEGAYPWSQMSKWNGATVNTVVSNHGLSEVDLDTIVSALTGSIGR